MIFWAKRERNKTMNRMQANKNKFPIPEANFSAICRRKFSRVFVASKHKSIVDDPKHSRMDFLHKQEVTFCWEFLISFQSDSLVEVKTSKKKEIK